MICIRWMLFLVTLHCLLPCTTWICWLNLLVWACAILTHSTYGCESILWMNPTPYTHACASPPYACMPMPVSLGTSSHVPMERFKKIKLYIYIYICILFHQIAPLFFSPCLSPPPSFSHHAHLLHSPPFHICFLFFWSRVCYEE